MYDLNNRTLPFKYNQLVKLNKKLFGFYLGTLSWKPIFFYYKTILKLYIIKIHTGSFLTAGRFGDTVPESASVSPFDDITLGRGLSDHHSPTSLY